MNADLSMLDSQCTACHTIVALVSLWLPDQSALAINERRKLFGPGLLAALAVCAACLPIFVGLRWSSCWGGKVGWRCCDMR